MTAELARNPVGQLPPGPIPRHHGHLSAGSDPEQTMPVDPQGLLMADYVGMFGAGEYCSTYIKAQQYLTSKSKVFKVNSASNGNVGLSGKAKLPGRFVPANGTITLIGQKNTVLVYTIQADEAGNTCLLQDPDVSNVWRYNCIEIQGGDYCDIEPQTVYPVSWNISERTISDSDSVLLTDGESNVEKEAIAEAVNKLDSFYDLKKNWNGYGGAPPRPSAIQDAKDFLQIISKHGVAVPIPTPSSIGQVGLFWHGNGVYGDFRFKGDGTVSYRVRGPIGGPLDRRDLNFKTEEIPQEVIHILQGVVAHGLSQGR